MKTNENLKNIKNNELWRIEKNSVGLENMRMTENGFKSN